MDSQQAPMPRFGLDSSLIFKLFLLAITILLARVWLIHAYSGPVPFWDQWDAEGRSLYLPYLKGELHFNHLFAAHNEHRIVLTRLLSLFILAMTGRWDPQLQMIINAFICTLFATGLAILLCMNTPRQNMNKLLLAIALLFSIPIGWENTLAGFQSEFYFLFGFSILGIWGLVNGPPFLPRFWVGIISSILACLSMASGFLVMPVIILVRIISAYTRREGLRHHLVHIAFSVAVIAISLVFMTQVPGHAALRAQSAWYFVLAFARSTSWPLLRFPLASLLFYLPTFALAIGLIQRKFQSKPHHWVLLGLALWVLIQGAAIAHSRGGTGLLPGSRYQDILMLGILVNFAVLLSKGIAFSLQFVHFWSSCAIFGISLLSYSAFTIDLPNKKMSNKEQQARCTAYITTGDMTFLTNVSNRQCIPYPDAKKLAECLDDPDLRKLYVFTKTDKTHNVNRPLRDGI